MGLVTAGTLAPLQKDHLSRGDLSLNFMTQVFRTYLADQSICLLYTSDAADE